MSPLTARLTQAYGCLGVGMLTGLALASPLPCIVATVLALASLTLSLKAYHTVALELLARTHQAEIAARHAQYGPGWEQATRPTMPDSPTLH